MEHLKLEDNIFYPRLLDRLNAAHDDVKIGETKMFIETMQCAKLITRVDVKEKTVYSY